MLLLNKKLASLLKYEDKEKLQNSVKCGKDAICLLKTNTPLKYKVGDYL